MESARPLPVAALLCGVMLAAIVTMAIVVLLFGLAGLVGDGSFSGAMMLRGWVNGLGFALPAALLIGFPLAMWRLRDPLSPRRRWSVTGAVAGALAGILSDLVLAFASPAFALFGPAWPGLAIGVLAIATSAGMVAAQLARRFTLWLAPRFSRA